MSDSLQVAAVVSVVVAAGMVSVVPTASAQRRFTPQAELAPQRAGASTDPADRSHR